jgi:hypothetical protein
MQQEKNLQLGITFRTNFKTTLGKNSTPNLNILRKMCPSTPKNVNDKVKRYILTQIYLHAVGAEILQTFDKIAPYMIQFQPE